MLNNFNTASIKSKMSDKSAYSSYREIGVVKKRCNKNMGKVRNNKKNAKIKQLTIMKKNVILDSIIEDFKKEFKTGKKQRKNVNASVLQPPMAVIHNINSSAYLDDETTGLTRNISAKDNKCLPCENSVEQGRSIIAWILNTVDLDHFFNKIWERNYLHIKRNDPTYFSSLISIPKIDTMLRQNRVEFTKNIDITSFDNQIRMTHNPVGRALPPVVWDYYKNGCSVRLVNPQTFIPKIHKLNATLQEYFQCMTGANVYLTPANSQGFAPHYDDIEAFVLQVEGKKRWKIYKPRSEEEILPRVSSENFLDADIGHPIYDVILTPGDVLYFPRGFIHQASTVKNQHSLHITLSVYQKNSWGDLMEILVPTALNNAIANNKAFREGLPLHLGQHMGIVYSNQPSNERELAILKIKSLFNTLIDYALMDDGVDAMHKNFQHDALPPVLTMPELSRTVFGMKPKFCDNGLVKIEHPIDTDSKIRLLRLNVLRLVKEDEKIVIYYSSENSKEYHEFEQNFLEIEEVDAPLVEYLIRTYPEFTVVGELPNDDIEKSVNICSDLWERGLLLTENLVNK